MKSLLAAAFITYMPAAPEDIRQEKLRSWMDVTGTAVFYLIFFDLNISFYLEYLSKTIYLFLHHRNQKIFLAKPARCQK